MEQNHIIKLDSKNSKDYPYKYSSSNYHKKTKTETNIFEGNPKSKEKINLKSLRLQNIKIPSILENTSQNNIKKINSVGPLNSSSYSKIEILSKTKSDNNKNKNQNFHNQPLSLQFDKSNNKQYLNIKNNKRNAFGNEDKEVHMKKNKPNTSLSLIQELKNNQPIEYLKNKNQKNNIIKMNHKNEYLDLNKIIKKEKKIILNKLNSSKSSNNCLNQCNKDLLVEGKINKNKYLNSYSSKYIDYLLDDTEFKNSFINISYGAKNNCLSFSENNKNKKKLNSFNNSISPSDVYDKNNKRASVFGQYYIDIDLSMNCTKDHNCLINKRLLKKTIGLNNFMQKDFKKDTKSNIFTSPIERSKKSNSKNIIDLRNNYNYNYLSKKYSYTSREKLPNIINSTQPKKIEFSNKNKKTKNNYIPYNINKITRTNDYQNLHLLNHINNNNIKRKSNYNLAGSKLKKSNNMSKKELFYNNGPKMWKDYINFQKNIKCISHTPKNRDKNEIINYKTEQIAKNSVNLDNKNLTENRLKKDDRTENFEFKSLNSNINKNMNKRNVLSQQNIFLSKEENFLDDFNSIDNTELKISIFSINHKKNNKHDNFKKSTIKKGANLSEYNNTQESVSINDTKSKKSRYLDSNLKDINLLDSVSHLDTNCFNSVNKSNKNSTIITKKFRGMQFVVSNTNSGKKKLCISPSNNKIDIIEFNGNNKKCNKININIDECNSKNYLNNNKNNTNRNSRKAINYTEYNKELLSNFNKNTNNSKNNNKKESHTLLKSISFCKKINNPVKLYPKKRDTKINKAFYIPSYVKRIYVPNHSSSNKFKKCNNTVEIKQNNENNNMNDCYKKYKNNIININNNTSNVNVLNVKNSSINICFEKKEKYKDLSLEKNINYSTTVNSAHRNNKINKKIGDNDQIEKNEINNKFKANTNEDILTSYIKISPNLIKNNNINSKRNEKMPGNSKKCNLNIKNNTQQISINNSEINLISNIKANKRLCERPNNIKINLNATKEDIDININKINLNSARNENIYNTEIEKSKKAQNKFKNIKENYFKKINIPVLSTNDSISVINKKLSYAVYVKPTCVLSRSKSKNKTHSEIKSKIDSNNKNKNNNKYNSKIFNLSKTLNNENSLYYKTPFKNSFQSKFSSSFKLSYTKLMSKSARTLYRNSIEKKNINKTIKKKLKVASKTTQIRNGVGKSFCFFNKFYCYFLKGPKIIKCFSDKKFIYKNLNKEKVMKISKEEDIVKNTQDNIKDNCNNEDNNLLNIENIGKNEIVIEDNNNKNNSNKIINDDEKINESSQNGLIMTFGEVNNTKKNSDKINTESYKNNDIVHFTNDIVNDESDLDIYKKLNIIQLGQNQEMKNEDNISENEDIKLYFSDDDDMNMDMEKYSNPLYNSNKLNNELNIFYESTNGKEIEDINKKVCKTFKKKYKGNKYNLENAEKGLRILKKIVVRRGYKSEDDQIPNNIKEDTDENSHKIYLGTSKLNELFNNRKERDYSFNKQNNSYNIKYRNKYSRSVNKDILKGITKIENFFEKKYFNDNTKINTYEGKNNNFNYDFSDENSCNIDNLIDYDEVIKPKIRTYVQKSNNLYFSNIKVRNDFNIDDDYVNMDEIPNNSYKKCEENIDKEEEENIKGNANQINEENILQSNHNCFEAKNMKEIENNDLSLKENLLKEFNQEDKQDIVNNLQKTKNININSKISSNKEGNILIIKEENNSSILEENCFLENIIKYQSKNTIKHEIIYLLNILTVANYHDILNKIKNIILYQNNNLNNNENIIINEHLFKDIIFKKSIELLYINLYAKLCYDLHNIISNTLIEQKNLKNNKERNLKFIINEECIIYLNKYKNISKEYSFIIDKESDDYVFLKKKVIGYVIFVFELINFDLLKQQFGFFILEQFYKKYTDNELKILFKDIYLEASIELLNKLGKNIFEKNNKKLIQNINNYIKNNLQTLISNQGMINNHIESHIKYKIINIIKKNENSWKDSLFELFKKENNKICYEENENKLIEKKYKEKKAESNSKLNEVFKKDENKIIDNKGYIIEEDLKNYISYFSEQGNKGEINIKKNVDKSYNWKAIDELINEKNFGLEYIINQFILICSNIIHDESQLVISNDYIKNIIEYYSNNLQKNILDSIHNEMIKTFLNVDDYIKNNYYMSKILGNLLFILIENRLYHIKDFNNYLKVEQQTQINLAIITKYCIISSGKFAKKYFNDFKQTKLFINNNIFKQYVTDALKDLFYFIK